MDGDPLLLLAVGLPFLAAALTPFIERRRSGSGALVAAAAGILSLGLLLGLWWIRGETSLEAPWIPSIGANFLLRLDALSLLFSILITGVGSVIFAYSRQYMAGDPAAPRFYAYMSLFMGSMLGLVLSGDLILLFVFWELTTLSSFLLIGLKRGEPRSVSAALKALLITGLGGLALLVSFLLFWYVTGSFEISTVLRSGLLLRTSGLFLPALGFLAVGVATKSAQFPLHIWLPDAMVAPTPVSAYLHSAAMVKAGIYVLARFAPALAAPSWEDLFLPLGTLTMLLGGIMALRAVDLKRILAYSTISQLGLMVAAFGFPTDEGRMAGTFHLVVHALMKSSLFLVAGLVTWAASKSNIRHLGGLGRRMPLTTLACLIAALSLAGLPPLGGFLSKEALFSVSLEAGLFWAVLAVLGGALTFGYSLHFFTRIFLGHPPEEETKQEPLSLAIPALLLASGTVALGLYPAALSGLTGVGTALPTLLTLHLDTLLMSGASILGGSLILWRYEAVAGGIERALRGLGKVTLDGAYQAAIRGYRTFTQRMGLVIQNGSLRRYAGVLLLFILVALLWPLPVPDFQVPVVDSLTDVVLAAILLAMVAFAVLAASLKQTLHAILSLSGMGFLLAMTFMLLNAPDLAMTQVLVELVLLVIFLIILNKIPFSAVQPSRPRGALDVLLSLGMVVGVTALVALSLSAFLMPSVASYYLGTPIDLTGGRNVVNLVVTDFRAFDTLGEITVIGVAALTVYTLLRRWGR